MGMAVFGSFSIDDVEIGAADPASGNLDMNLR